MDQESELRTVPSWKAHKMTGDRKGTWSLFVTRNWRITFQIDQAEIAFSPGDRAQGLVILVADYLHRLEEQIREEEKHDEIAHVHAKESVAVQSAVTAQQGHCAEEKLAFHL